MTVNDDSMGNYEMQSTSDRDMFLSKFEGREVSIHGRVERLRKLTVNRNGRTGWVWLVCVAECVVFDGGRQAGQIDHEWIKTPEYCAAPPVKVGDTVLATGVIRPYKRSYGTNGHGFGDRVQIKKVRA
jgi:hypothetical protein